jgi:hypothetical protein
MGQNNQQVIEITNRRLPCTPLDYPWLPPKLPPVKGIRPSCVVGFAARRVIVICRRTRDTLRQLTTLRQFGACASVHRPGDAPKQSRKVALRLKQRANTLAERNLPLARLTLNGKARSGELERNSARAPTRFVLRFDSRPRQPQPSCVRCDCSSFALDHQASPAAELLTCESRMLELEIRKY